MDGGAWQATVHGVAKSRTRLSGFTFTLMKIMVTSFKRSHACTATLSTPNPAAGHHLPTAPPETPGHSWAYLGQSLVDSLFLSPGSWWAQRFVYALQDFVSAVLSKFWWLYNDVNGDLPVGFMPHPGLLHPEPLPLQEFTAHPYIHRRHSNTVPS